MNEAAGRSRSRTRRVLAWGVHLFTASGAVVGALALTLSPIGAAIAGALLHALAGVEASVGDRAIQ